MTEAGATTPIIHEDFAGPTGQRRVNVAVSAFNREAEQAQAVRGESQHLFGEQPASAQADSLTLPVPEVSDRTQWVPSLIGAGTPAEASGIGGDGGPHFSPPRHSSADPMPTTGRMRKLIPPARLLNSCLVSLIAPLALAVAAGASSSANPRGAPASAQASVDAVALPTGRNEP
jgi:hypothetical protein